MAIQVIYSDGTTAPVWTTLAASTPMVDLKIRLSTSHPRQATFAILAPQHTKPIPDRADVILVDPAYGDITSPIFEGHVHQINPAASNRIEYTCFDQTMRARQEITIMDGPHGDSNSTPRLVYNAKIDNDDDKSFELRTDAAVGLMLRDMLTFGYNELVSLHSAAPPVIIGGDAFMDADLAALTYIPQEKMVFESEKLGQGIDRLLMYYPNHRVLFIPGLGLTKRKWRIYDQSTAPTLTLTLNKFSGAGTKKVFSVSVSTSLEQRATAVQIDGPRKIIQTVVYHHATDSGTGSSSVPVGLLRAWTMQEEANFRVLGPWAIDAHTGYASRRWQVADPLKRRLARILPIPIQIAMKEFTVTWSKGGDFQRIPLAFKETRQPTLEVTYDEGRTWWPLQGCTLDVRNGIITAPYPVHQWGAYSSSFPPPASVDPSQIGEFRVPDNERFIFAYLSAPRRIRYPESGYAGQAYDAIGMEVTERMYDEQFAHGYETNFVIPEAEREAQYEELVEKYHEFFSIVNYSGGVTIMGIDYDFLDLQKRINITSQQSNGTPQTTGWESMNAPLSDVEFDYQRRLTTLQFGSDAAEAAGRDIEEIRERLKAKAEEIAELAESYNPIPRLIIELGNPE